MITRESLEKRISELKAEKQKFVEQAVSQASILEGAIQNSEYLLTQVDKESDEQDNSNPAN